MQRPTPSADAEETPDDTEHRVDPDRDARPSKSARKREMTSLQKLGEELVAQSAERLEGVEMPERLRDAIRAAQRIHDHEGRRRQLQYVGKLMRDVDPAPIRAALDAWNGASRADAAALHALERWRERLIDDDDAVTAFATEHTGALNPQTMQKLRATIRMTRKERVEGGAPRHYRELFRLIRGIVDTEAADASP